MAVEPSVREGIVAAIPRLRAFAVSLTGSIDRADDLVQETMVRAYANIDKFQPGTHLAAWLFTILRNQFRSEYRKRKREVEDVDGRHVESLTANPEQYGKVEFNELHSALAMLPSEQREALILVGASGFSYDEAAVICECAVGTIKSRLSRARSRLLELLSEEGMPQADRAARDAGLQAALESEGASSPEDNAALALIKRPVT